MTTSEQLSSNRALLMKNLSETRGLARALVGASFLEDALEVLLRSRMLENSSTDKLFEPGAGRGSLRSKAGLAHSLGLLPTKVRENIELVADIRNAFAHDWNRITFDTPVIKDKCVRLDLLDYSREQETEQPIYTLRMPEERFAYVVANMCVAMSYVAKLENRPKEFALAAWNAPLAVSVKCGVVVGRMQGPRAPQKK